MFIAISTRTMAGAKQIVEDTGINLRRSHTLAKILKAECDHDAHVHAFRTWQHSIQFPVGYVAPDWVKDIIATVAAMTGVSVSDILSRDRRAAVAAARAECAYHLWTRKSARIGVSLPVVGKWLNRDHSTIFTAIAAYEQAHGLPVSVGMDIERRRQRMREWYARNKRMGQ